MAKAAQTAINRTKEEIAIELENLITCQKELDSTPVDLARLTNETSSFKHSGTKIKQHAFNVHFRLIAIVVK